MKKVHLLMPVLLAVIAIGLMFALILSQPAAAQNIEAEESSSSDQAHIVIQFDDRTRLVREISFTAPISGLAALESAGLEVVTSGGFVCSINGVGCPADNCFCDSKFWGYSYWDGSSWQDYMVGAASSSLADGAIEGWRWGEWGVGAIPPASLFVSAVDGLDWIRSQQVITTGGYGTASSSAETLLAIGANGLPARDWRASSADPSLSTYFQASGAKYAGSSAATAGKMAVGLAGTDGCWPLFAPEPIDDYDTASGVFSESSGEQSWAILGIRALSQTVPQAAVDYLKGKIQVNGGWEWTDGFGTDTNTTALAVQALIASGEPVTATEVIRGVAYLDAAQNEDGGFPYDPVSPWGTGSDVNSTAYVVQAIYAVAQNPITGTWVISDHTPLDYLLGMQLGDGSFEWQSGLGSNLLATQQAIAALIGRSFPYQTSGVDSCSGILLPLLDR